MNQINLIESYRDWQRGLRVLHVVCREYSWNMMSNCAPINYLLFTLGSDDIIICRHSWVRLMICDFQLYNVTNVYKLTLQTVLPRVKDYGEFIIALQQLLISTSLAWRRNLRKIQRAIFLFSYLGRSLLKGDSLTGEVDVVSLWAVVWNLWCACRLPALTRYHLIV